MKPLKNHLPITCKYLIPQNLRPHAGKRHLFADLHLICESLPDFFFIQTWDKHPQTKAHVDLNSLRLISIWFPRQPISQHIQDLLNLLLAWYNENRHQERQSSGCTGTSYNTSSIFTWIGFLEKHKKDFFFLFLLGEQKNIPFQVVKLITLRI